MAKQLRVTDQIHQDVVRQAVNLMRFSEGVRAKIISQLEELEANLVKDLLNASGKTDFTIARMRALLQQTRETIASAYDNVAKDTGTALEAAAKLAAADTAQLINDAVGAGLVSVVLSPEQLEVLATKTLSLGAVNADWWAQQDANLVQKF